MTLKPNYTIHFDKFRKEGKLVDISKSDGRRLDPTDKQYENIMKESHTKTIGTEAYVRYVESGQANIEPQAWYQPIVNYVTKKLRQK